MINYLTKIWKFLITKGLSADEKSSFNSKSLIYESYYCIKIKIEKYFGSEIKESLKFFNFLRENTICDKYIFKSDYEAAKIFDYLNNRGIPLEEVDIIRNLLLRNIKQEDREEYYKKFGELLSSCSNITFRANLNKILILCFELKNENFKDNIDIVEQFHALISKGVIDGYTQLENHITRIMTIEKAIKNHKIGKIITSKQGGIGWDTFKCLIVPFVYKFTDGRLDDIIKILAAYYFRTYASDKIFNIDMNYRYKIKNMADKIIKNPESSDYIITEIKKLLREILSENKLLNSNLESEFNNLQNKPLKKEYAKRILAYYSTIIENDHFDTNLKPYDLEHIASQKENTNNNLLNTIGNLTLLEAKNSKNGFQGNRSIQNKKFSMKILSYRESGLKITREISKIYTKWDDQDIIKRGKEITSKIDEYTKNILN